MDAETLANGVLVSERRADMTLSCPQGRVSL